MRTILNNNRVHLSSDHEYKNFVQSKFVRVAKKRGYRKWIKKNMEAILSVYHLNLEPIHEKLAGLYSSKRVGKPPYDPQVLLRSFLLMVAMKEVSITKWVSILEFNEMLLLFCGLSDDHAPSVGTHYDFLKRLENGQHQPKCVHCVRASDMRKARLGQKGLKQKPKDLDEIEQKNIGVMDEFTTLLRKGENQPVQYDLERLLNEILRDVAVKPSIEKKFIQNTQEWSLVGDGSIIKAQIDSYGKLACDCRKQGIYNCKHERSYSDPNADWGWDNRDKCLKFGYHYFQWGDSNNHHDLPIYLQIGPGNLYEPKMALDSITRLGKQIQSYTPDAKIKEVALDAMHDIYATYRYLRYKKIDYAIPLRKKLSNCMELCPGVLCNQDGCPLCPAGAVMVKTSTDKNGRHVYQCPAKRCTHEDGKMIRKFRADWCPRGVDCMPESKIGPLVRISCDTDPRIHPNIPRDSKHYKDLYDKRSGCERSNSMKKYTYQLSIMRVRTMSYSYIRLLFASILEHSRVWVHEIPPHIEWDKPTSVLSLLR